MVSVLPALVADLRENHLQFVSCRVPIDQTEFAATLEQAGFIRIETQRTYWRTIESVPTVKEAGRVILAPQSYEDSCVEIARRAFIYDRFHSDPLIDKEKADDVKGRWTRNSFRGRADACLVIPDVMNLAVGFVLCMRDGEDAVIDLIAVNPDHYGKGLGKALVSGALAYYRGHSSGMRVGTQDTNRPSIALYESMGFVLQAKMATYHWHNPGASS